MENVIVEIHAPEGMRILRAATGDRYVVTVRIADCHVRLFFHPNMLKIEDGLAKIDLTPDEPNPPHWSAE